MARAHEEEERLRLLALDRVIRLARLRARPAQQAVHLGRRRVQRPRLVQAVERGIRLADVEHSIGRKVDHTIVSDGRSVVYALNRGVPFVISNREAQVSQDISQLAATLVGRREPVAAGSDDRRAPANRKSLFAWR